MTDIGKALHAHLEGMASPFLFVGAGLSRRYAKTDGWRTLLQHFALQSGHPLEYFLSWADGDLPWTATEIARMFHPIWWQEEQFRESRSKWESRVFARASPLKIEVAERFASAHKSLPKSGVLAEELEILRTAVIDGIITTNYDRIMEKLFPEFEVFVGQDEMLFANLHGVGEIYKVHGCCSNPDSIVLTGEDYERFDQRNPYLAAKLLAVFIEHPVVFLGYSLDDRNVRRILNSIASCLTQENIEDLTDRLIFVRWAPDEAPSISLQSMALDDCVLTVNQVVVPDFIDVFVALAELKRAFPVHVLRQFKQHVYELVQTDDPQDQLAAIDFDGEYVKDLDVVFGVGVKQRLGRTGYVGLGRLDLLEDVLCEGDLFESAEIVSQVLPKLVSGNAYVPVFKYLRGADLLTKAGTIRAGADVDDRIKKMAHTIAGGMAASKNLSKQAPNALKGIMGIQDLWDKQGSKGVFNYGLYLPVSRVDVKELRVFLLSQKDQLSGWTQTQWGKLVCMLDWIEYGKLPRR